MKKSFLNQQAPVITSIMAGQTPAEFIAESRNSEFEGAQGIAIDINPRQNPMVRHDADGTVTEPAGSRYDAAAPGTLNRTNTAKYLSGIGWSWGGRWPRPQDHQHIEKSRGSCAHLRFSLK